MKRLGPDDFNPSLFHDAEDWAKINWLDPSEALWVTANFPKTRDYAASTPAEFWSPVTIQRHNPTAICSNHGEIFAICRGQFTTTLGVSWKTFTSQALSGPTLDSSGRGLGHLFFKRSIGSLGLKIDGI